MKRKIPKNFFYLLLVLAVVYFLNLLGVFRPLRAAGEKWAIVPLKETVFGWQRFFKKDLDGCSLNEAGEIAALKVKIASLAEENEQQKRLLSSPLPKNWQFLPVKVIGLSGETLTINLGSTNGVKEGMVAVWADTYLGKVKSASENLAQIYLPSFLEERLSVWLVSADSQTISGKGLLIGRGEGKMRVEQILSTESVAKGDLVMTNVEGGDVLVGEVEEILAPKGEAFKTALVKRLYNPEELGTIFLIRGKI